MKLSLLISFLGTNYVGWQKQKNGVSVQEKLGEAAESLFCRECDITGCSRTDSGVHANEFFATITEKGSNTLNSTIDPDKIPRALNRYLPDDIAVKSAVWREASFHPRYSAKHKEYIYRIYNSTVRSPFESGRSLFYPKPLEDKKLSEMNRAASHFLGRHDFRSFMASGSDITDTKRTVINSDIFKIGDIVIFRVSADGFLYNMVRIMAGTILEVAEGKISPDDSPRIISLSDRRLAGRTLPPHGLYLNKVVY